MSDPRTPSPSSDVARLPTLPRDLDAKQAMARMAGELFGTPVEPVRLGRFTVLERLGSGGMGVVYAAFDPRLDRSVALKLLRTEATDRHTQRLIREAQALAKLSHPNVVHVYDVGQAGEQPYIAMEMVRGQTLRQWQQERRDWRTCVEVYLQAGDGLAAAHAAGLVHRDFKPDNCIIDDEGRIKVLDFGLVRETGPASEDAVSVTTASGETSGSGSSLTRTGAVLGTLAYMPLEQLDGKSADARSDQFSFCVSLYEALYGERPFAGDSVGRLTSSLIQGIVQPAPKGSAVPARLRRVLLRGLAVEPAERWPSMEQLLARLRRLVAPRRGRWIALGLGLVGLGVAAGQYAEVNLRCEGARAQLDGVWDEARRQQVEEAILGTELPYAADTWRSAEERLDEYAAAWADKHTEVCEATSVRQEQSTEVMDLRMGCLQRRRIALREVVGVLAQANVTRVTNAVATVAELPGLVQCDDIDALRAELPPPEDPAVAAQVKAQRERLARVSVLIDAGEYDDALTEIEDIVEQALALGYEPLQAEALRQRGWVYSRKGREDEAVQDLEQAYALALTHDHDAVATAAAAMLSYVVGGRQEDVERGRWWGLSAVALGKARSEDPLAEAFALSCLGIVHTYAGEFEQSLEHHQRAVAIREQVLGPRHPKVASSLDNIGGVLRTLGRYDQAVEHHRRALAIHEDVLGPRHPAIPGSLYKLGRALRAQGKLEEALEHQQRGLAIREEVLGPKHPGVATSLMGLANVLIDQGKFDEGLELYQRGLKIAEEVRGPRHPEVSRALHNIAVTLSKLQRLDESLAHFRRASSIWEEAYGPRHLGVATTACSIGSVLDKQGEFEDAWAHLHRGFTLKEEILGADSPELAFCLVGLAKVAVHKHDMEVARPYAERAVSLFEAAGGQSTSLPYARFALARALWPDPTERARAVALAERAREGCIDKGTCHADELAEVEAWLEAHAAPE